MNLAATWAGEDGVVVSTDADTVAEQDWLAHLLAPLAQGADAACGRILLDAQERARLGVAARRTHLYDAAYHLAAANLSARLDPLAHDPAPRHAQHFGANLALTVRAYRAVGGIPDVSALEDVALIHALLRADLRVCHTPRARVRTSARLGGRVEVGLSSQLREWDVSGAAWRVPGGDEVAALARAQAAFRSAYRGVDVPELAALWLTPRRALGHALSAPTEGGGLELAHAARWAAGLWPVRYPPYPVEQALWSVRLLAHEHV